jgi:hypothetical protein
LRFSKLTGQFCIGQALVENAANQFAAPFPITRCFAIVEPESLLVQVAKKMKRLDAHVSSLEPALEQAPKAFQVISVNVAVHVFDGVVDDRVLIVSVQSFIGQQLIGEDRRASFHVVTNLLLKFFLGVAFDYFRANPPAAFHESHNHGLIFAASAGDYSFTLILMHEARETTNHTFVNFYFARQLAALLILHGEPDTMEHEPRGFLSNSDGTVNLPRTNPVPVIRDHPHRSQPLVETEWRIFKDSSGLDGELATIVALIALPAIVLFLKDYIVRSATRTYDAIRPAARNYVLAAMDRNGEINNRFLKGSWLHASDYGSDRWSCQVYSYPR